jgi:subtilisin
MSLGGDSESTLVREAIARSENSHLLIVAAAGNDGPNIGSIDYPGANAKVVAVGALDSTPMVPSWSSRGINDKDYVIEEREVEFAAPGVNVESTYKDGGYATMSGTSMATPHISGLAAKLWQDNAADTRTFLQGLVWDIGDDGDDPATGFGLPTVQ